jgi:hypothetical protein
VAPAKAVPAELGDRHEARVGAAQAGVGDRDGARFQTVLARPSDREVARFGAVLAGAGLALTLVYLIQALLGSPSWTLHLLVDLDAEGTLAAWYTSAQLLLAGMLFFLLGGASAGRPPGGAEAGVGSASFLRLVGAALLLLSLDETAGLHELISVSLRRFEALPRFTGDHGLWVPFLLIGVAGFLVATRRSWLLLWRNARAGTLLLAAGLGVGLLGAVGLEIVSYELIRPAGARRAYLVEVAAEEGLEMLGATLLLIGSLRVYLTAWAVSASRDSEP